MNQFRRVLCLVGAGASIPTNAPATAELLRPVLNRLPTIIPPATAFARVGEKEARPYPQSKRLGDLLVPGIMSIQGRIDYELILQSIEELIFYCDGRELIAAFTDANLKHSALFDSVLLREAYGLAQRAVVDFITLRSPATPEHLAARDNLRSLFLRVGSLLGTTLVTLNYDDLLDDTLEWADGFVRHNDSTSHSVFDPISWAAAEKDAKHLLMHLHGSIRFGLRPSSEYTAETPFDEPAKYRTATEAIASTTGVTTSHRNAHGQELVASTIVAGGFKGSKLFYNLRPYAYYSATALKEIARADALLVIGYGWNDEHVNSWVDEWIRLHPAGKTAVITKRPGSEVEEGTNQEKYLERIAGKDWSQARSTIFEPMTRESLCLTHGVAGRLYLVASGMPMSSEVEDAVIDHLFKR